MLMSCTFGNNYDAYVEFPSSAIHAVAKGKSDTMKRRPRVWCGSISRHLFSMSLLPLSTAWMALSKLASQPVAFYAAVFFLVNSTYICLIWELVDPVWLGRSHRRCAGSCTSDRSRLYAFSRRLRW